MDGSLYIILYRDEVDGSLDVELESLNSGQGLLGQTSMQMEEQVYTGGSAINLAIN